jgi:hypothetical protein
MVPPIGGRASDVALRFASPRKRALGCEVSDELTVLVQAFTQHERGAEGERDRTTNPIWSRSTMGMRRKAHGELDSHGAM